MITSTARIVVATNGNLEKLLASSMFRGDLYYRLCSMLLSTARMPTLNESEEFLIKETLRVSAGTQRAAALMRT